MEFNTLQSQQDTLGLKPPTKPTNAAIGSKHPMAGDDYGQRIAAHRASHGAGCVGLADGCAELLIGDGLAEWNRLQAFEHLMPKPRAGEPHGEIEVFPFPPEVLVQLLTCRGKVAFAERRIWREPHLLVSRKRNRFNTLAVFSRKNKCADG